MRFASRLQTFLSLCLLVASANASPPHVPRQSNPKYVVAHVIVGNLYGYTQAQWANDIALARQNGIDGFALNIGNDPYTADQINFAYSAADSANFKMFLSLDMGSFPCSDASHANILRTYTTTGLSHASQLMIDGKALVSTFSGSSCTFGQGDPATGWRTQYTQSGDLNGKIHFVPSFFIAPNQFSTFRGVMDGDFNWNSGWPIDLTPASAPSILPGVNPSNPDAAGEAKLQSYIGSFASDSDHINNGLSTLTSPQTYMAAVTPWFFTHFPVNTYNKNWVYDSDEHLWARRWQTLIANRDHVDLVEILTWNDFGESHYIGPIEANLPPGSSNWVNGFDHQAWLRMTGYFASYYKTGVAPTIFKDQLILWARPHPANATATSDSQGRPTSYQLLQDKMWAVVFATAPGQLKLSNSASSETFNVNQGVNLVSFALSPGGSMSGVLTRNSQTVISLSAPGFTFNPSPALYNYNAYVVDATA